MSASDMNVETLKKSLAANGLAQYGTKEQMLHRLLTGGTEKKKPGPKPKGDVPKKKKKATSDSAALAGGGEEAAFMAAERPRLAALFTDPTALEAELKRRWTSIKKSAKSPPAAGKGATPAAGIVKLPAALDAKQMAAMNLIFLTNEISPMTGSPLYVYGPAAAKVKAEPGCQRPAKKCKREEEEEEDDDDDDDDDDDNMTWACEVAAMRLLKKCKKETLIMLCNDFGIRTSGNKEKLAEEAAEQLHYETDDSDDDDQ